MTDREAVQILKASRKGFKAALTRARNVAESAFQDYVEGDDPGLLEEFLGHWDNRLQKFLSAEDQVNCHLASDIKDSDPAVDEHVQAFFKAKSKVVGFREMWRPSSSELNQSDQFVSQDPAARAFPR
jgi:hypothetical protein